jgi:hypothetical protein
MNGARSDGKPEDTVVRSRAHTAPIHGFVIFTAKIRGEGQKGVVNQGRGVCTICDLMEY